jgi:N-acetylmuramoyl-L-alanine amidase CwlA
MQEIEAYITSNKYSRPGRHDEMDIKLLLIHWTGVANQRALQTLGYFEYLKAGIKTPSGDYVYGSSHAIDDQDGTIYKVMPYNKTDIEMAYHAGDNYPNYSQDAIDIMGDIYPNRHCLALEWCFYSPDGMPTDATLSSAAEWYAARCIEYKLDPFTRIQTHNWVTGKGTWGIEAKEGPCHRWFVEHPDELYSFQSRVMDLIADTI